MMKKRAFTLIELLVVMAIIGALISITMPSLGAVRRVTKKTTCQTCLREISAGLTMYLNVHNQTFPYAAQMPSEEEDLAADEIPPREPYVPLPVALEKELGARSQVFLCPADRRRAILRQGRHQLRVVSLPERRASRLQGDAHGAGAEAGVFSAQGYSDGLRF
jgi:prepilin-type N-terminal cleavage/methylation domain-containing protein